MPMSVQRWARPALAGSLALAIAVFSAACSSSSTTPAATSTGSGASSSSISGTLKLITWENPPAVSAINAIDKAFMAKYPKVKVSLQTAANVNGPYETLLQQTVDSGTADIVTANTPFLPLPLNATR